MIDRTPTPAAARPPLPEFAPVPRRHVRHDGWTPERQRAFIEALTDTGSVSRAAAMVNMAAVGAYQLRRHPEAAGFRAAWAAALDFGVARLKDIAFERAVEGALVPVITGGRLIGYRRVYNDRLLMFCLRHYGEDANGKRTTINYFSTRASADGGDGNANAEASTTTVRTVITGGADATAAPSLDATATALDAFAGVPLDEAARAEIAAALDACAARRRAEAGTADDPAELFFAVEREPRRTAVYDEGYAHPRYEMISPPAAGDLIVPAEAFLDPVLPDVPEPDYRASGDEFAWTMLDSPEEMARIEAVRASFRAPKTPSLSPTTRSDARP